MINCLVRNGLIDGRGAGLSIMDGINVERKIASKTGFVSARFFISDHSVNSFM
jgi:hypothetical protein